MLRTLRRPRPYVPNTPMLASGGYGSGSPAPADEGGGAPSGGSRFQQKIDQQRALDQRSAARFAASAPLPTATANTPATVEGAQLGGTITTPHPAGEYNGAFAPAGYKPGTALKASDGSSIPLSPISPGAAQQTAQGARNAFVQRNEEAADLGTGNFFQKRQLNQDWNTRENAQSGANVAESGARVGFLGARTNQVNVMTPIEAGEGKARTGLVQSQAKQVDATTPYVGGEAQARTNLTNSQADANWAGAPALKSQYDALAKEHAALQKENLGLQKIIAGKRAKKEAEKGKNQRANAANTGQAIPIPPDDEE